jgi:hypothetical protein
MTSEPKLSKKKNILFLNILFVVVTGGLLIFLLNAPKETTAYLPKDDNHTKFFAMQKKEAEKFCETCHSEEGDVPLPEGHPPKYRCLFCHKRK